MNLTGRLANEEARERFRREARTASVLQHPNIVTLHEIGEQHGQIFFSMELIEGGDLSARLRDAPPSPRQAAEWILALTEAVGHAHAGGVIHRDIKPGNILLDKAGVPHLTDFGLAKALDGKSDLTLTGQMLGSASYRAPKQAHGHSAALTGAVDIYALGAVLYHLQTGRPPFLGRSLADTLKQVADTDPIAPRRLIPSVPRDLETIALKCLEKPPARRYASAGALAEDLRCWLAGKPIHARPVNARQRGWRWSLRNPLAASLTLLLGLALLGGFIATARQLRRAERFLGASERAHRRITQDLKRSEQRQAEALIGNHRHADAIMALTRLVQANPSNTLARARLFSALAGLDLPWPALPPLVHDAEVQYGPATPDAKLLLTASRGGFLHVWDGDTGERRFALPHDTKRGPFALAADGSLVATLSTNGTAEVWHLPEGARLLTVQHPNRAEAGVGSKLPHEPLAPIVALDLSTAASLLATAGDDGRAYLWRLPDGERVRFFEHSEAMRSVRFQPQGRALLTVGATESRLWHFATNQSQPTLILRPPAPLTGAEFSPKGDKLLATGDKRNQVNLYHLDSGLRVLQPVQCNSFCSLRFTPNGRRLCVRHNDASVALLKLPTAAAPGNELWLPLAELWLGQRLNEQGGWPDLTRDEFLTRQRTLTAAKWRLGPDPQVIVFR